MYNYFLILSLFFFSCSSPKVVTTQPSGISNLSLKKTIHELVVKPILNGVVTQSLESTHQILNRKKPEDCATRKYAGEYEFGNDFEIESVGWSVRTFGDIHFETRIGNLRRSLDSTRNGRAER